MECFSDSLKIFIIVIPKVEFPGGFFRCDTILKLQSSKLSVINHINFSILFNNSSLFLIDLQLLKSEVGVGKKKIIKNQSLNRKILNPLELKQNSSISTVLAKRIVSVV